MGCSSGLLTLIHSLSQLFVHPSPFGVFLAFSKPHLFSNVFSSSATFRSVDFRWILLFAKPAGQYTGA